MTNFEQAKDSQRLGNQETFCMRMDGHSPVNLPMVTRAQVGLTVVLMKQTNTLLQNCIYLSCYTFSIYLSIYVVIRYLSIYLSIYLVS